jgi:16S rRNA (cytosine1402-N4)-methyltransferase
MKYHVPVLLKPSVEALQVKPDGIYADLTFGGGGHTREIMSRLGEDGRLMVFDQDADALNNLPDDPRIIPVHANFRYIRQFMLYHELPGFNGILADLGISSWQIDEKERGFSFRFNAELDMRMNRETGVSAKDILNHYSGDQLRSLFRTYGELKNAGLLANRIIAARDEKPVETTGDLVDILSPVLKKGAEHKFLARVFQALRIEVNKEMEALREMLKKSIDCLLPGGRLVVLSYHSLEDRMVKNFMRAGNVEGEIQKDFYGNQISPLHVITKKPVQAGEDEINQNPRARSVKMRVAERKKDETAREQ